MHAQSLEKAMAPHSSTLAWKIPWIEEPGRLQSMGSLGVGHDWTTLLSLFTFHFHALEKEIATHSSVLAWRTPWTGEPGRLLSLGSHRVGHDWSDLAAAAQSLSCVQLTLWDALHCGPSGSSVHGILQAWILEWVAIPDLGIEPGSLTLWADSLPSEPLGKPKFEWMKMFWRWMVVKMVQKCEWN